MHVCFKRYNHTIPVYGPVLESNLGLDSAFIFSTNQVFDFSRAQHWLRYFSLSSDWFIAVFWQRCDWPGVITLILVLRQ